MISHIICNCEHVYQMNFRLRRVAAVSEKVVLKLLFFCYLICPVIESGCCRALSRLPEGSSYGSSVYSNSILSKYCHLIVYISMDTSGYFMEHT